MRPGLNVVWAKEPTATTGLSMRERAGHGVGKSTFSLMLRFVLGDDGKAVKSMRHQLASEMPNGGVGAVIHIGDVVYSVFRPFGTDGFAASGSDLDSLLNGAEHVPLRDYIETLSRSMLANLQQTEIPGSGQKIDWAHILGWATRDQGTRLRTYYDWRSDGAGLQRAKQDPPWVLRSVLGVTDAQEANAVRLLGELSRKISRAETSIRDLELAPKQIRSRIEVSLRTWAGASADIELINADMFQASVLTIIEEKKAKIQRDAEILDRELNDIESELRKLENAVDDAERQYQLATTEFDVAEAQRDHDEAKIKALNVRLNQLRSLSGDCAHGAVAFRDCSYIQARLKTTSFVAGRDKQAIEKDSAEWASRAVSLLPRKNSTLQALTDARSKVNAAADKKNRTKLRRDTKLSEFARPKFLLEELASWEEASGSMGVFELNAKKEDLFTLTKQRDSAEAQMLIAKTAQLSRKTEVSGQFERLAKLFELNGRFQSDNEEHPFELVGSAGEAYSVLEILLGDFACLLDSVGNTSSCFPGFLIHDCPREADLSDGLYGSYLMLLADEEKRSASWQVIVTTTTPPPHELQASPYLVLELGPAREEDLLLRRRFGLR